MLNNNLNFKIYNSPLGEILLCADNNNALCGLYFNDCLGQDKIIINNKNLKIFDKAVKWLDVYFAGREPDFTSELKLNGTEFQVQVWKILLNIKYGETVSYGDIAEITAAKRGIKKMAAQAVGQAVGRNNISIIIPCHRVIGRDKSLVGYGLKSRRLDRKAKLLELEGAEFKR